MKAKLPLFLLVFCLALSGCAVPGKRAGAAAMALYDLGEPPDRGPANATIPLLSLEVRAPQWFDSVGIQYRLAYAEPTRLRAYAQARWVAPPTTLVQQRLAQQMALAPLGQGRATCLLRLDIDEFSQVFDTPQSSQGQLQVRAAILDRNRNRLAEREVDIEKDAPSQDSKGGVAALTEAVDQLDDDLGGWLAELAGGGQLKDCER